jgi:carbonic anhydrase
VERRTLAIGVAFGRLERASLGGALGLAVALTGVLQLIAGLLGFGRFARLAPRSVVHGFTVGIGGLLVLLSLPYGLGVAPPAEINAPSVIDQIGALGSGARPASIAFALVMAVTTFVGFRVARRVPIALIALFASALVVRLAHIHVPSLPDLPVRIPRFAPLSLPTAQYAEFVTSGLALFAIATLETFFSASAEEHRVGDERNDPDQDLVGYGLANIASSLFGGIPVAGSIVRARALRDGEARTRASGAIHAVACAALVPLVLWVDRYVPLAALAGVIVAHAARLFDPRPIVALFRVSRLHAGVASLTAATIVFTNVLTGVETGLFLSLILAMLRVARFRTTLHRGRTGAPHQITFSGPITFLAIPELERLRTRLAPLDLSTGVILDVRDVFAMDPTGCHQFVALVRDIANRGGNPAVLGCAPACRTMLLADDARALVEPRLAVSDRDVDRILGRARAFEMRAHVVASLERFRAETRQHYEPLFEQLADGQHPHTLFITCVDSRISPSMLTGCHPGEIFVVRCLGAMVPPPVDSAAPGEGAAIEYAVGVLGVRNIVVCGHSQCGAVKAAKSGHVPDELASLKRWLESAPLSSGDLSAHHELDEASRAVVVRQIDNVKQYALVRERIAAGDVQLHAWFYDVGQAELFEWNEGAGVFEVLGGARASLPPGDEAAE